MAFSPSTITSRRALERRDHRSDVVLRSVERLDAGALDGDRGAGDAVDHQLVDLAGKVDRHRAVAEPPAGHRVGLREAVEDDRALRHAGHGRDRDVLALVDDLAVDLVGEDDQVVLDRELGDPLDVGAGQDAAGRVAAGC